MQLCSYGCGNEGKYKLKNEKFCCSLSPNSCPIIREKNSVTTKKTNHFINNASKIRSNCKWCNRESSLPVIKRHEKFCYLNPINIKFCPVCNNIIKNYKHNITCSSNCAKIYFKEMYREFSRKNKNLTYRSICFDNHEKSCIICGEKNIVAVHHYDGNRDNNSPENLIPLCPTHHVYIHSKFNILIQEKVDLYRKEIVNKITKKEITDL